MKPPTVASRKKVTAENLSRLGVERLSEILVEVAAHRPELKRRLRMELAAEQGSEHLLVAIDKRLASLAKSRSRVLWRQRSAFVGDVDGLRGLIAERLASVDPAASLDRMWRFMDLSLPISLRIKDRDGEMAAVFTRAASDIGVLTRQANAGGHPYQLVEAMIRNPKGWVEWLPGLLDSAPPGVASAALAALAGRAGAVRGSMRLVRLLADASGNVDAFCATYSPEALQSPVAGAEVAQRLLAVGRLDDAARVLETSRPVKPNARALAGMTLSDNPHYAWETVWIDYLERSGHAAMAQEVRWSSFEWSLSVERARAFTKRLTNFEDVEAEDRAFEYAAGHPDFEGGLGFLMEWPALSQAARMIQFRADEVQVLEKAELWATTLRPRHAAEALLLLRKAAAAAFRRRDYKTADRLSVDAEAIFG